MPAVKRQVSSGGVIYRKADGKTEIAITLHEDLQGKPVWSLAKGLVEPGESVEGTAVREVREETGLEGKIVAKLGDSHYWYFSKRDRACVHKVVHFFLLERVGGRIEDHDREVDEVRWVSLDDAVEMLSYEGERQMVEKARGVLSDQA